MSLQTWGTPGRYIDPSSNNAELIGVETYIRILRFVGMPRNEAQHRMRLFADKITPAKKLSDFGKNRMGSINY